ncbi:unnamed protein product [Peniophora sp. CBMAI 1063]|nr:unnamed protein product [Peniophora sp. CBMAI 1063]
MTTAGETSSSAPTFDALFNAPDTELVLRSSDGVDFAVHKLILQLASPVFRDMLSLPQPSTPASSRPVISMVENAPSLRLLLHFIYPRTFCEALPLSSIADVKRAAALAGKYDIQFMREAAEMALVLLADDLPDIAYAVAWRYELPIALHAAAQRHLGPFRAAPLDAPEFDEAPASAFKRLEHFSNTARKRVEGLLLAVNDPQEAFCWIKLTSPTRLTKAVTDDPSCMCGRKRVYFKGAIFGPGAPSKQSVPIWWWRCVHATVRIIAQQRYLLSIDDPFDTAVTIAQEQVLQCPQCRLKNLSVIFEATRYCLRAEIKRRINEVQVDAPFIRKSA